MYVRAWKSAADTSGRFERMSLVLSGKEFIAAAPLGAGVLAGLASLASRRPVLVNGVRLSAQELTELAEEARRTERDVWVGARPQVEAR